MTIKLWEDAYKTQIVKIAFYTVSYNIYVDS